MTVKLPPFQRLLDEHRVEIYRFLVATAEPADADDAFQETWISALRMPAPAPGRQPARGSFASPRTRPPTPTAPAPVAPFRWDAPEQAAAPAPEGDEGSQERLRALPEKQRTAVFCRSVLGMPYAELAALLESSEDAARRNVHEGLKRPERSSNMSDIETTLRPRSLRAAGGRLDVATRADAEGLVDVAYASVDSRWDPCWWQALKGLVRVAYSEFRAPDDVLEDLARRISPRVLEAPARLDPVRRELDEYFGGARRGFDVAIDWSHQAGLHARRAA